MNNDSLSKKYVNEVKAHKITKTKYDKLKIDYNVLEGRYNALLITLQEEQDKMKLLQKGAYLYTLDQDGYIDNEVIIPNDFESSYVMELTKEIGTKHYNANRFYRMENGQRVIDKERQKKYIGGLLL